MSTRTVANFNFNLSELSMTTRHDALLDTMQYRADPLADDTITAVMGTCGESAAAQTQRLAAVTRVFNQWTDNRSLVEWAGTGEPPEFAAALKTYVEAGRHLPDWADPAKLARAEAIFMDYGALSVTMLFCSSLPECYVIPDLAAVLHVTGQLEARADHRVRATGAMVFPVMMRGGLTTTEGGGIAAIFKVRLIHATIRHLILRQSPAEVLAALGDNQNKVGAGVVPPLAAAGAGATMQQALFAHGWKTGEDGLPCNQEELAYTLLTFSYVFLRSMRILGLGLPTADEEAYLHGWNVAGSMLGIERGLMADTMADAQSLYDAMQARGRVDWNSRPAAFDPRPALGNALVDAAAQAIPLSMFKSFPVLMTRYLCGPETSADLGLNRHVSWFSMFFFATVMGIARVIDTLVRLVFHQFSIVRLLTRIIGYHLITKLMLSQTRPLKVPTHLLNGIGGMMHEWSNDPKSPGWINAIEDWATVKGSWRKSG